MESVLIQKQLRNELEGSVFLLPHRKKINIRCRYRNLYNLTTNTDKQQKATENITERTPDRPYARTPVRRQPTRYAFEFYQDQIEELRRISLEEKMQGGKGNMSKMVREAIDEYLTRKKPTSE